MMHVAIGVVITLTVTGLYNLIKMAIKRNVTVKSPERRELEQIIPAVNEMLEMMSPVIDALILILKAQKGMKLNGNIETALIKMEAAKTKHENFLVNSAKV